MAAPEVVIDYSRRLIDPFVVRGLDDQSLTAVRSAFMEVWQEPPVMEPLELRDAGDKVYALVCVSGRGRASGAGVEVHVAHVITFCDALAVEFTYFGDDIAAALEAARLVDSE